MAFLCLVDPGDAHTAQGQHVGRRGRAVAGLLHLEKHLHRHVAGERLAEDMHHQLDERILTVAAMFSPEDREDVIAAFGDEAVAEQTPDEIHKLLIAVH